MRSWSLLHREELVTAIVTELVANAVRHAGTALELRLVRRPGKVRVEVRDRTAQLPRLIRPEPLDEEHRGMLIVDEFSDDWGADRVPGGKVVWAEVGVGTDDLPETGGGATTETGGDGDPPATEVSAAGGTAPRR